MKKEINIDQIAEMLTDDPDIFVEGYVKCSCGSKIPEDAEKCKVCNRPRQAKEAPRQAPSVDRQAKRRSEFY